MLFTNFTLSTTSKLLYISIHSKATLLFIKGQTVSERTIGVYKTMYHEFLTHSLETIIVTWVLFLLQKITSHAVKQCWHHGCINNFAQSEWVNKYVIFHLIFFRTVKKRVVLALENNPKQNSSQKMTTKTKQRKVKNRRRKNRKMQKMRRMMTNRSHMSRKM